MGVKRIGEGLPSRLENLRMRAGELIAGPDFQRKYATRVAEAIELEVARAREASLAGGAIEGGGLPITAGVGTLVSKPGDVLASTIFQQRQHSGPIRLMRPIRDLQTAAWVWWHVEPIVGNVIIAWTALTIGNGINIEIPEGQKREDGRDAREAWQEFDERHCYSENGGMIWEAVFNTFLFGEWFHWFEAENKNAQFPTMVRALDPISKGGILDVKVDPNDVQKIINYTRISIIEPILPEKINHWKLAIGGTQVRGRPIIERVFDDIFRLQQTRLTTWMLQEFRLRLMTLFYIREKKIAGELPKNVRLPDPLTITEFPPGSKPEVPDLRKTAVMGSRMDNSPERLLTQAIAQGVFLPYHLTAQEFREANLASLRAAEGPLGKTAEFFVSRFERFARADVRKVVGFRQQNGEPLIVNVNIPPVIIRDQDEERKTWLEVKAEGEISRRTFHEKIGLDPNIEEQRLKKQIAAFEQTQEEQHPVNQMLGMPAHEKLEGMLARLEIDYNAAGQPYGDGDLAALLWLRDRQALGDGDLRP